MTKATKAQLEADLTAARQVIDSLEASNGRKRSRLQNAQKTEDRLRAARNEWRNRAGEAEAHIETIEQQRELDGGIILSAVRTLASANL